MRIERFVFGKTADREVDGFVLHNGNGLAVTLIGYGARLTRFLAPDRDGRLADIVLGFDDLASYLATNTYFGATCGRYGNRIKGGEFAIDGKKFLVDRNEGVNHLHGGRKGFDRKIWEAEVDQKKNAVTFTTTSPDGEQGFPGTVKLAVTYRLADDNTFEIRMHGSTDAPTVLNTVHHTYWNLAGHGSGDVRKQELKLFSDFYTPVDTELITTGEVRPVAGTVFDFRDSKAIGEDIDKLLDVGTGDLVGGGYDHNWCLNGTGRGLRPCARVVDPQSGRGLELHTTEPGVQFYTGGYLSEKVVGKGGTRYCRFAGYTFETQKFPNAPNFAHFPTSAVYPGDDYDHQMMFRIFTE